MHLVEFQPSDLLGHRFFFHIPSVEANQHMLLPFLRSRQWSDAPLSRKLSALAEFAAHLESKEVHG